MWPTRIVRIVRIDRIAALAVLAATTAASASPRSDPTEGRAVFTGATVSDPTSIELNPAAIGMGSLNSVYVAATGVLDQVTIGTRVLDPTTSALSPGPSVHDVTASPGAMIAAILHLKDDRFTVGFSLGSAPANTFPGGDAIRYLSQGGDVRTYSGGIATSFRITDDFYLGVGLSPQSTYLHLQYARDTALAGGYGASGIGGDCGGSPCGIGNPQASEQYDVVAHTQLLKSAGSAIDSVVSHLGIVYRLARYTFLGVAWHEPPGFAVQTELSGSMTVTQSPRDGNLVLHGASTVYMSQPASVDGELRSLLAGELELHVGVRWQDLSRQGAYDVRGYGSTFTPHGVPEWTERPLGFRDPVAMWAGVEQVDHGPVQIWRFGGRIGFETAAVNPSQTAPLAIAPLSLTGDLGAQVRVTSGLIVQLTYGIQYFPTVHVNSSAYDPRAQLACIASGYDYSTADCASVRYGYAIATAAGDYDRIQHAARFALRYEY